MNKRKAIVKFIVILTLVVVGVLACFNWSAIIPGLRVPLTDQKFNGFIGSIKSRMGIDLRGGVLAVFDTEGNPTQAQIDATVKRLERMLADRNNFDTTVVRQGRQIRIEMPGTSDTQAIFDAIGTPAKLEMRVEGETEPFLTGEHVSRVDYYQDPQTYEHGVKLTFTAKGGELFRQVVENATVDQTKIEILLNGNVEVAPTIGSKDAGKDNTTVITGNYTQERAKEMKTQIESGLFEVTLKPAETSIIDATLGSGALNAGFIACIIGLVFIFILMFLLYGDFGLLCNLSLLVFVVIFLFLLAVINVIQLTLPGIAGIILSIAMSVDANILIFERVKDEYRSGKRLAVAVENGFNKTVKTIVDANITTIIAAAILYLLGTGPVQGFAITLFLGVAISMFCSLLITRSFAKTYLYINNSNEKRVRFGKLVITDKATSKSDTVATENKPRRRSLNLGGEK